MPLSGAAHLLILAVGAASSLLVGMFLPRHRQSWNAALAAVVLALAAAAAGMQLGAPAQTLFDGSYRVDHPGLVTSLLVLLTAGAVIPVSLRLFRNDAREAEYYTLLLLTALGAVATVGATDFIALLLGVLLLAVASYPLVAFRRSEPLGLEAGLKYYLFGALANIALAFGLVLLYGLTGSTLLAELPGLLDTDQPLMLALAGVLVTVGLGFHAGYVPSHFWIPDVYQAAPVPVAALLSVLPKLAGLLALTRLMEGLHLAGADWQPVIALIAAVTMTLGNLAAFRQQDVRRLLGYSGIAHGGYLLLALLAPGTPGGYAALLYYLLAFALAKLGAFAVIAATARYRIEEQRGLIRRQPLAAVAMLVALLSLVGIPPLAGFIGKFTLLTLAAQVGYGWLTVLALGNMALSLFYYLRVITPMFTGVGGGPVYTDRYALAVALLCALGTVAVGLAAAPLIVLPNSLLTPP